MQLCSNMNSKFTKLILAVAIGALGSYLFFQNQAPKQDSQSQLAPIPQEAFGPQVDQEKGYFVEEIGDGLYWITEGSYQVMFLTTGEGVVIVDAPPSIGENILAAIKEITDEPITHVIYSHSHADHIAAASIYPDDAIYIAHEDTASNLDTAETDGREIPFGTFVGGSPAPQPSITFSDSYTLNVGNQTLQLDYKGPNHNSGNIFIYAPKQKVLMLVDVVFPGWSPFLDLAVTENVFAYVKSHDDILKYDFDTFIGGHLTRLGTREDVVTQKEYIMDMQANAATALQTVDFNSIAQEVGFENPWNLFNTYLEVVNQECADLTLEKWQTKLAGADIFTISHCARLVENLRIN